MNNKGFAISGMVYSIMLVFLVFITVMLFNLQDRKTVLDELKADAVKAVESANDLESLEARIAVLEDASNIFLKSHPVGSIYVTVADDESTVEKMETKYPGSTWEVYGSGRVLVGTGSNGTTSYNSVNAKGGSETNSTTLTTANLPSHTHSISHTHTTPATSLTNGSAASAGAHTHTFSGTTSTTGDHNHLNRAFLDQAGFGAEIPKGFAFYKSTSNSWTYNGGITLLDNNMWNIGTTTTTGAHNHTYSGTTSSSGAHTHTVTGTIPAMTTNSQSTTTSGATGSGTAFTTSTVQPYVTVYMYKRIS